MPTKYKTTKVKTLNDKKKKEPWDICRNKDCPKLGQRLTMDYFFKSRNPLVVHHPYCKDCVNKMIDINNMDTVYNTLKVLDTPFIMDEWDKVIKSGSTNYLGDYLKLINFNNKKKYEDKTYDDSIFELSEEEPPTEEEMAGLRNSGALMNEADMQKLIDDIPTWSDEWQGRYSKADLKYLNDYYNGLQNDFKIVTTNHKDYARKIAQASLSQAKAYEQMLDGKDGADAAYEKATKIFDMLSKSAQFAESQRGANDVSLGCFGKVFDAVEKHQWVPSYTPDNQDIYDKLLDQFSNIGRSL